MTSLIIVSIHLVGMGLECEYRMAWSRHTSSFASGMSCSQSLIELWLAWQGSLVSEEGVSLVDHGLVLSGLVPLGRWVRLPEMALP